jgi:hypothetical protein
MNPPLEVIMFVNDRGESAPQPGTPTQRVNLIPVQGQNSDLVPVSAQGNLSGNVNFSNLTPEAAALLPGGKKFRVTFEEIP